MTKRFFRIVYKFFFCYSLQVANYKRKQLYNPCHPTCPYCPTRPYYTHYTKLKFNANSDLYSI